MNRFRNRAVLYVAELALAAVLVFLPIAHDLPILTAVGLFLHLTTSLSMLPFQWRATAMGAGAGSLFGIPNRVLILVVIVAGSTLMLSWMFGHSTPAYLAGVVFVAWGIEEIVTLK